MYSVCHSCHFPAFIAEQKKVFLNGVCARCRCCGHVFFRKMRGSVVYPKWPREREREGEKGWAEDLMTDVFFPVDTSVRGRSRRHAGFLSDSKAHLRR